VFTCRFVQSVIIVFITLQNQSAPSQMTIDLFNTHINFQNKASFHIWLHPSHTQQFVQDSLAQAGSSLCTPFNCEPLMMPNGKPSGLYQQTACPDFFPATLGTPEGGKVNKPFHIYVPVNGTHSVQNLPYGMFLIVFFYVLLHVMLNFDVCTTLMPILHVSTCIRIYVNYDFFP
jgi:hypothetical protein